MMKKIVLCSFLLIIIGFQTGCNKVEKLHCNKAEATSENLELKESLNITFKGNEVTQMTIYSEIKVSGSYVNYIDDLATSLKQQYVNLEGKKGIEFKTSNIDNVLSVTIDADLKKMDADAKKELSIGSVRQSIKDAKKELEEAGYTCN